MGCNVSISRQEGVDGGGEGDGKKIILAGPIINQKINEVKRRIFARDRKDSIVSTTELLGSRRGAVDSSDSSPDRETSADDSIKSANPEENVVVGEEKKIVEEEEEANYATATEDDGEEDDKKCNNLRTLKAKSNNRIEEELPGSPSFRFYVQREPEFDDGSVRASWMKNDKQANTGMKKKKKEGEGDSEEISANLIKINEDGSTETSHEREDSTDSVTSSEESVKKTGKKGRARKLRRGFSKSRNRVYKLLNIRNCYSQINPTEAAAAAAATHRPQRIPSSGKLA